MKNEANKRWHYVLMHELFERVTDKNVENNDNILTISAQEGLVRQKSYFTKNVASANLAGYILMQKGDFAYNRSSSAGYPFGAVKVLKSYDKGIVSPLYICFRAKEEVNPSFFEHYFHSAFFHHEIGRIVQEGARNHGMLNVNIADFFNIRLYIPKSPEEQTKIAECLNSISRYTEIYRNKLVATQEYREGLLQKLLPDQGGNLLRFRLDKPTFADSWSEVSLGQCFEERTETGYENLPLLSLTEAQGIVPQNETGRRNNSSQDKSRYLHVCAGDIVYNTMRMWQGRCAYANIEGIVSPAYTVCKPQKGISGEFFANYFKTPKLVQQFYKYSQGLVNDTLNLRFEDFSKIRVLIPPNLEEQQRIANCLNTIDSLTGAYSNKLQLLDEYRRGLLQQLFPTNDYIEL